MADINLPITNGAHQSGEPSAHSEASSIGKLPKLTLDEKVDVPAPNPFSVESLRISQDFADGLGVERHLVTVPIRKPSRTEWFRVHPAWVLSPVAMIQLKEEREVYAVAPSVAALAVGECGRFAVFPAITRQGVLMLWPVRIPGGDGRSDRWSESAHQGALRARTSWTRLVANMQLGAYDIYTARAELPEPEWPNRTFEEVFEIGFRGRVIDDPDHPVLRRLRGEL